MKLLKFFLSHFFTLFFTLFFTPVAFAIVSKLKTGDWLKYFSLYSIEFFVIIFSVFTIWFVTLLYYKISSSIRERNDVGIITSNPEYGWNFLSRELYKDVFWLPRFPVYWEPEQPFRISKYSLDELEIEVPPACPKCEIELEETKTIFGWYVWKCVDCGFKVRRIYNFKYHSIAVAKIVRRKLLKQLKSDVDDKAL